MISFEQFKNNLASVQARIHRACEACGRNPNTVKLLPITKHHPIDAVNYAITAGLSAVGENKVQEAVDKQNHPHEPVTWELVGHLQSNKAKLAVEHFQRIQSVDSLKLLERLNRLAGEFNRQLPILLQVNTAADEAKFGLAPQDVKPVVEAAISCKNIDIQGFMTIGELSEDLEVARNAFESLRNIRDDMQDQYSISLPELSMGMSQDLEVAIECGSTIIRIGSALYGKRT